MIFVKFQYQFHGNPSSGSRKTQTDGRRYGGMDMTKLTGPLVGRVNVSKDKYTCRFLPAGVRFWEHPRKTKIREKIGPPPPQHYVSVLFNVFLYLQNH